nr:hypothetical protein [Rhodobacter sp. NTK016B]
MADLAEGRAHHVVGDLEPAVGQSADGRPGRTVDHTAFQRRVDLAARQHHGRATQYVDRRVVDRRAAHATSFEAVLADRLVQHDVVAIQVVKHGDQLQPLLLVIGIHRVPNSGFAQGLGIARQAVQRHSHRSLVEVIGTIGEQQVEQAARHRVELLERGHGLGAHDVDAEALGHGFVERLDERRQHVDRNIAGIPARQQAEVACLGGTSQAQRRGRQRRSARKGTQFVGECGG